MENKSKHTPGPWTHSQYNVNTSKGAEYLLFNTGPNVTSGELRANARLIASAPDLLEACKEAKRMYDEIQPSGGWQCVDDLLINAITAAT
jgi:hypothetical protein